MGGREGQSDNLHLSNQLVGERQRAFLSLISSHNFEYKIDKADDSSEMKHKSDLINYPLFVHILHFSYRSNINDHRSAKNIILEKQSSAEFLALDCADCFSIFTYLTFQTLSKCIYFLLKIFTFGLLN